MALCAFWVNIWTGYGYKSAIMCFLSLMSFAVHCCNNFVTSVNGNQCQLSSMELHLSGVPSSSTSLTYWEQFKKRYLHNMCHWMHFFTYTHPRYLSRSCIEKRAGKIKGATHCIYYWKVMCFLLRFYSACSSKNNNNNNPYRRIKHPFMQVSRYVPASNIG